MSYRYHRAAAMRGNEKVGSSLRFITFVSGGTFLRLNPHSQQPLTVMRHAMMTVQNQQKRNE